MINAPKLKPKSRFYFLTDSVTLFKYLLFSDLSVPIGKVSGLGR